MALASPGVGGQNRCGALDFRFPNAMELFIDPPGRILGLLEVCMPEDCNTTRLTLYTMRNFARLRILDPVFRRMNRAIAKKTGRSSSCLILQSFRRPSWSARLERTCPRCHSVEYGAVGCEDFRLISPDLRDDRVLRSAWDGRGVNNYRADVAGVIGREQAHGHIARSSKKPFGGACRGWDSSYSLSKEYGFTSPFPLLAPCC